MRLIHAEITLINGEDMARARRHVIGEEVGKMTITALVDTGAYTLCINEVIQEQPGFPVVGKRKAETADGRIVECDLVDFVQVKFKNRATACRAMVLPADSEPLLGSLPLEDMDVLIHPQRQELIVNPDHPYYAHMKVK